MPDTQSLIDDYLSKGRRIKKVAKSKRGRITLRQTPPRSRSTWDIGQTTNPAAASKQFERAVKIDPWEALDRQFFYR